jgi:hypothetical protein
MQLDAGTGACDSITIGSVHPVLGVTHSNAGGGERSVSEHEWTGCEGQPKALAGLSAASRHRHHSIDTASHLDMSAKASRLCSTGNRYYSAEPSRLQQFLA